MTTRPRRAPARPVITPPGTRPAIPRDALRAAYNAHMADTHAGDTGYRCPTCTRYTQALTLAATQHETAP
jgi:hypothetical protein